MLAAGTAKHGLNESAERLVANHVADGFGSDVAPFEDGTCDAIGVVMLREDIEEALARRDLAGAEQFLRRSVATDPFRETAQRALMETLAAGGSYAGAAQVYRELRLVLHREMNAEPDAETQALFQQLRTAARAGAASAGRVGPGSRSVLPSSLPAAEPSTPARAKRPNSSAFLVSGTCTSSPWTASFTRPCSSAI